MFRSYRIGVLFGFPIEINVSFLLLLGLFGVFYASAFGVVGALLLALVVAVSVLLHELGHALVARHLDVHIAGIEIHVFGGAAKMTSLPKTAHDEILIAAAGPAVSFALGGVGVVGGALLGMDLFAAFGWINLILGAFNLIPALPMDGGRILRALLTRKYDFVRATDLSVKVARGFAVLLGVYGLFTSPFFVIPLAVALWFMGSAELHMAQVMRDQFTYDRNGYRYMYSHVDHHAGGFGSPPPRAGSAGSPLFGIHRPVAAGRLVIRRERDGRIVIEHVP